MRFVSGAIVSLLVYLLGWDNIEAALTKADQAVKASYHQGEKARHQRLDQ